MAKLDALYARLQGMPGIIELLWRVADHFDHLHVAMAAGASAFLGGVGNIPREVIKGPGGGLKGAGQGVARLGAQGSEQEAGDDGRLRGR